MKGQRSADEMYADLQTYIDEHSVKFATKWKQEFDESTKQSVCTPNPHHTTPAIHPSIHPCVCVCVTRRFPRELVDRLRAKMVQWVLSDHSVRGCFFLSPSRLAYLLCRWPFVGPEGDYRTVLHGLKTSWKVTSSFYSAVGIVAQGKTLL